MITNAKIFLFFLFIFSFQTTFCTTDSIAIKIAALEELRAKIIIADDTSKYKLNDQFRALFLNVLESEKSFDYDFSALKSVMVLSSSNHAFRIYTWVLEIKNNVYEYYGFTQYAINARKGIYKISELVNNFTPENPEFSSTDAQNWMGALYYQLVEPPNKKDKKYLLLGWDGNSQISNKKIIEVISFDSKGEPNFGSPIIKFQSEFKNARSSVKPGSKTKDVGNKSKTELKSRVVFEYTKQSTMTLKFDVALKMVIFDHLAPASESTKSIQASYAPDFSYDGLYYESGKWIHQVKLDARNEKMPKPKKYKASDYEE